MIDDKEAKSVMDNMTQAVVMLGGDKELSINEMFDELLTKIQSFREQLENE